MTDVTPAIAQEPDGTRARILAEAIDMFTRHGYHRTSLRQLADRLGITKAAILYHFPAKERILAALMEPFIDAMEAAIDRAARIPLPECRTVLLEGLVDTYLDHRPIMRMARTDGSIFTHEPIYQRILRLPKKTVEVMVGPDADLGEQVWAVQMLASLGDPVMFYIDEPRDVLRAAVLAGPRRMLDAGPSYGPARRTDGHGTGRADAAIPGPPPPATPAITLVDPGGTGGPNGAARRVGRPRALSGARIARARDMYRGGSHTVDEIAATLGVSRATVYRYLSQN